MTSKSVPSYRRQRRANGKDDAFVELGGVRHYLGSHGSKESRERYGTLITEWESNGARPLPGSTITVSELIAAFWQFAQEYYRKDGEPTVQIAKIRTAVRPLTRLYGRTLVSAFGPLRFKTVRQPFIDAGHCRTHVNQQAGIIKQVFKWGTEQEIVPASIFHGLLAVSGVRRGRTVARDHDPVVPVPEAHIDAVLPLVPQQIRALIEIQLLTGCRPSEARLTRACDIDMTGWIWSYRPSRHKTQHHGINRVI